MRSVRALACALLGFALVTAGCSTFDIFRRADKPPTLGGGPRIGSVAPEIDGEDFDGKHLKLSDYRGKVVVVVFWAKDCMPCRAMIPHEKALAERYRDRPFAILGVNNDQDAEPARKLIASQGMTWPIWHTQGWSDPVNKRWDITFVPAIFVLDANGVVRYKHVRGQELDNAVATLLAEMEKKR